MEMGEDFAERPLVYVAAPYTSGDSVANTANVVRAAGRLADTGLVTPFVPHLTMLWHLVEQRPLEWWYSYDLAILRRCDALLRLAGASTGADREVQFAQGRGVPVFFNDADLLEWARGEAR